MKKSTSSIYNIICIFSVPTEKDSMQKINNVLHFLNQNIPRSNVLQ